ncbi:MAG: hypothetical protein JW817_02275 [Clostridiales bacterium]|nr:hypothetical protein [Clostridiales bacterium]
MSDEYQYETARFENYKYERRILIEGEAESSRDYEKSLLVISSGAIGLSVGLTGLFAGSIRAESYLLLFISWVLFGATIIAMIAAYNFSSRAFLREIDKLDKQYLGRNIEGNTYSETVKNLKTLSACFLISAILILVLLVYTNLP